MRRLRESVTLSAGPSIRARVVDVVGIAWIRSGKTVGGVSVRIGSDGELRSGYGRPNAVTIRAVREIPEGVSDGPSVVSHVNGDVVVAIEAHPLLKPFGIADTQRLSDARVDGVAFVVDPLRG